MKIELNKYYTTRKGGKAHITDFRPDAPKPWAGYATFGDDWIEVEWLADGRAVESQEHHLDLLREKPDLPICRRLRRYSEINAEWGRVVEGQVEDNAEITALCEEMYIFLKEAREELEEYEEERTGESYNNPRLNALLARAEMENL